MNSTHACSSLFGKQMAEKKQALRRGRPVEAVRLQAIQKQRDRWPVGRRGGQAAGSALSRIAEQNAHQNEQSTSEAD